MTRHVFTMADAPAGCLVSQSDRPVALPVALEGDRRTAPALSEVLERRVDSALGAGRRTVTLSIAQVAAIADRLRATEPPHG